MKIYLPRIDGTMIPLLYFQPKPDVPVYDNLTVERILRHRTRNGSRQWLVKWRGLDDSHNSWEPAAAFLGAVQRDWVEYNKKHKIPFDTSKLFD